jgi:hypothetical protein
MNAQRVRFLRRRFSLRSSILLVCALLTVPAWGATCPKLLFDGGVFIRQQTNTEQAIYWGRTIGVQGFLVHEVMRDWDTDVGTDPDSNLWKLVRQFQSIYEQQGVTDNFIRVGLFTVHNWRNSSENRAAVENFAHAAALAKNAGFKGMALDMEPYQPTWGGGAQLASTVQQEGRAIGQAMHEAFPNMTLIIQSDALHNAFAEDQPLEAIANPQSMPPDSSKHYHGGYQLAVPFLRGLLSVDWAKVVIATQETYKNPNISYVVQQTTANYVAFLGDDGVWTNISTAPGLWPLGLSYFNKSPRETPQVFTQHLETALAVSKQYVWIYGYGSAWQTGGHYGSGPVAANFQQYVDAVHQVLTSCGGGDLPSPSIVDHSVRIVPPRASEALGRAGPFGQPGRSVDLAPSADSFAPVGTLPRITPLRPAGTGNVRTEIP